KKGSKVYLEGALQTRKWTDQGGQERYSTEIVLNRFRGELTMLDGAGGGRGAGGPSMEGGYDEGLPAAAFTVSRRRAGAQRRRAPAPRSTISTTTSRSEPARTCRGPAAACDRLDPRCRKISRSRRLEAS